MRSGSISNVNISGAVAIRTNQQESTVGLFVTDAGGAYWNPFMQMFGTEEDLRAFAESILRSLDAHRSSQEAGESS